MKQFKYNMIISILCMSGGILVSLPALGGLETYVVGLPLLAVGIWQFLASPLKIYQEYFEYKPCLFLFSHLVAFADIESFIIRENRIIVFAQVRGKYKKISISLDLFNREDRGVLIDSLKSGFRSQDTKVMSSLLASFSSPPSSISLTFS